MTKLSFSEKLFFIFPVFIAIISFICFINVPFGHYDIWFERIAYSGLQAEQLPDVFAKLSVPLGINEYIEYRTTIVGRLFGMMGPIVGSFYTFGENALLWRLFLFVLIILTLFFSDRILLAFNVSAFNRFLVECTLVILFSRYYIKTISVIYGVGNLLLLISFYVELQNSLKWNGTKKYSWIAASILFIALLIRELFTVSVLGFAILLFSVKKSEKIRPSFKLSRIVPYAVYGLLFVFLFFFFTRNKTGFAYSNNITFSFLSPEFIKELVYSLLNFMGLGFSTLLGVSFLLLLIVLSIFLLFQNKGHLFTNIEYWQLVLSFFIVAPISVLLALIDHSTGSFTHQYLFGCIFIVLLFEILCRKLANSSIKTVTKTFFYMLFISALLFRLPYAIQDVEKYSKTANAINRLSKLCAKFTQSGTVFLFSKDLDYQESYAIITEMALNYDCSDIHFYQQGVLSSEPIGYMNYFLAPLLPSDSLSQVVYIDRLQANERYIDTDELVINDMIRIQFPFKYMCNWQNKKFFDALSKLFFSVSIKTLCSQQTDQIGYIVYPEFVLQK